MTSTRRPAARPSVVPSSVSGLYEVIRLVRPLYKTLETAVERELEGSGVTLAQRAVLERLLDEGPRTVPAIGRGLRLPRQFIQRLSNELLEAGLVERRVNPAHRRSDLLALTAAGRTKISAILQREAEVMTPIAPTLKAVEVEITRQTMSEMIRAFGGEAPADEMQREGD